MKKCSRCKKTKPNFRKHSTVCRECINEKKKNKRRTKPGTITAIYEGQLGSSKKRGHRPPEYTKQELIEWLTSQVLFHELYDEWKQSGYIRRLKPSVDRKCDDVHYCMSNIQLMTWGENDDKASREHKEGILVYDQKPVLQYDKEGNFIAEYFSQTEASRQTGIPQSNIWKVLEGKRKHAGGFRWQRKNLEN